MNETLITPAGLGRVTIAAPIERRRRLKVLAIEEQRQAHAA